MLGTEPSGDRRLRQQHLESGGPLALLLRAGAATTRARSEQAVGLLAAAEFAFTAANMALYATIARGAVEGS